MKQAEKAYGAGSGGSGTPVIPMQSLEELLVSFQSLHFTKRTNDLLKVTKRVSEQAWRKSGSCLHLSIQPQRPCCHHALTHPYLHPGTPPTSHFPILIPALSSPATNPGATRCEKPLSSLTPLISLSLNGKSCRTAHSIQTLHSCFEELGGLFRGSGAACPSFHSIPLEVEDCGTQAFASQNNIQIQQPSQPPSRARP